jgi:hypothetical protein
MLAVSRAAGLAHKINLRLAFLADQDGIDMRYVGWFIVLLLIVIAVEFLLVYGVQVAGKGRTLDAKGHRSCSGGGDLSVEPSSSNG